MSPIRLKILLLVSFWLYGLNAGAGTTASIRIEDPNELHTYRAGEDFRIDVTSDAQLLYEWIDFADNRLGDGGNIEPNVRVSLESPSQAPGYYGLKFRAVDADVALPDRIAGEAREYGFVVLEKNNQATATSNVKKHLGLIHGRIDDPISPTWIKSLTWQGVRTTRGWRREFAKRAQVGKIELPLIAGKTWRTNDEVRISSSQLNAIADKIAPLFEVCPSPLYLELGLEENLRGYFRATHYWSNLEEKAKVIRRAAVEAQCDVQLIYQLANLGKGPIDKFVSKEAAKQFDILSLHPYAWPNFPNPDGWLVDFLSYRRDQLAAANLQIPIWFTEVGAPHHGNHPDGFFGYPKRGAAVKGLSRSRAVSYMIQTHVIALSQGVDKVFWYHAKDRGASREKAEAHFGMRDYWGFPKPVYAAYNNLRLHIDDKKVTSYRLLNNRVHCIKFENADSVVWVTWHQDGRDELALADIAPSLGNAASAKYVNAVGTPLSTPTMHLEINEFPTFISANK